MPPYLSPNSVISSMQASRTTQTKICYTCSSQLLYLFKNGFCPTPNVSRFSREILTRARSQRRPSVRQFTAGRAFRCSSDPAEGHQHGPKKSLADLEAVALQARQTFGETLPKDFLSTEEYGIYERLYGPPISETRPEDVRLLQMVEEDGAEENENDALLQEDEDSNLEEVEYYQKRPLEEEAEYRAEYETSDVNEEEIAASKAEEFEESEDIEGAPTEEREVQGKGVADDFDARIMLYRDMVKARQAAELAEIESNKVDETENAEGVVEEYEDTAQEELDQDLDEDDVSFSEESESAHEDNDDVRTHPLTAAGKFKTSPATLHIHKDSVVDPITELLAKASNKHLAEVARESFGGAHLPNSTATPNTKGHLKQQPIALEASHFRMSEMEANSYLAAITPGIYAAVTSCLVEIRKRIGSEWLKDLLKKDGGPRILDAGGAGASVLAWRNLLRTEWELLHPDGVPPEKPVPFGKSIVVVGSGALRNRMSQVLGNTTFIPRLPDYNPQYDHPSVENKSATPRKQYDIIIAPHTLWSLKEDYMRKSQVQNFWSLLDPKGGVLLIVEKGVPRGFEFVAGAREVLLKHHIASQGSEKAENRVEEPFQTRFREKEVGMIIAPCTNHLKCPMYLTSGKSSGRKDHCHFSQRFVRPHFLQRILGARDRNHEDLQFSYIAVQRGIDQRQTQGILQGKVAADAAFEGYEAEEYEDVDSSAEPSGTIDKQSPAFSALSLPRAILPPLKRRGHVTLDLCTPQGQIERWVVPKSFSRQAYRDARKSRWGDLWALGAKTRTARNVRIGTKNSKAGGKSVFEAGKDDIRQPSDPKPKFEKQAKKGRKPKMRKGHFDDDDS